MAKKKYYAVKKGKVPGVYETWDACKTQTLGFPGAVFKSFPTREEAQAFVGMDQQTEKVAAAGTDRQAEKESVLESMDPMVMAVGGVAVAYVDGSYNVATGEYGAGVAFFSEQGEEHISRKGEDKELASMRNVAGEILGSRLAMEKAVALKQKKIYIYHDYQGIASWCLGEWKTNKEGTRQYKAYYDSVKDSIEIVFCKVKGHSGDTWNDLADELAKQSVGN